MPKKSNSRPFPKLSRIKQLNNYCCGPAALAMLLDFAGAITDQKRIIESAAVAGKIKERGMTIEELAIASKRLAPQLQFWFKRYSTIKELDQLVNEFSYPVGVEWQGVFEDDDEEENTDEDPGHYSVVTAVDRKKKIVLLADPYKSYAGRDRQFTLLEFERRWWDINEVIDSSSKRPFQIDDYHTLFIVTPKSAVFPQKMGLKRG